MNRLFEALSEIEIELLTPAATPQAPCAAETLPLVPVPAAELNPIATDGAAAEVDLSDLVPVQISDLVPDMAPPILVPENPTQQHEGVDCSENAAAETAALDGTSSEPAVELEAAEDEFLDEEFPFETAAADAIPEENGDGIFFPTFPEDMFLFDMAPPDAEEQSELEPTTIHDLPPDVFPKGFLSVVLELRPECEQSPLEKVPAEGAVPPAAHAEEPVEAATSVQPLIEAPITVKAEPAAKDSQPKPAAAPAPPRVILKVPPESRLVALTDPDSLGAEKFRALAARLEHQHKPDERKCFQVTSSVINEGKTLVSGNIGVTLAKHFGAKTLLVEGDLHRPTLASIFGLERLRGISHWWAGPDQELTPFVHKLEGLPLWFLPAGRPSDRPSDVLRSSRFVYAFERLASEFEWVVVDSTPMVPIVDVNLWSRLVAGTLLVVREGVTPVKALQKG